MQTPATNPRLPVASAIAVVAAFCLGVAVGGCSDPNGRQRISGSVTFDGEPLPTGSVSLRPVGTGPLAVGRIKDGEFVLPSGKGPLPGAYLIEIESQQNTGRKIALVDNPSIKLDEKREVIPPQYNNQTQLRIEVKPGSGNHFEFDLKSNGPTE